MALRGHMQQMCSTLPGAVRSPQQPTGLLECRFMGPFLFSALWAMVLWGFIQLFFRWAACSGRLLYAL